MAVISAGCGGSAAVAQFRPLWLVCLGLAALCAPQASAGETWISAGFGGGAESLYTYGGATMAPLGALGAEGLRARAWAKALRATHRVEQTLKTGEIPAVGAEAEMGWQFVGPHWRFALYGGGAWREEADRASRFGVTVAADGSYDLGSGWRAIADVKYTAGFDELWAQFRPEFKADDGLYVGLVSSVSTGRNYSILRGGASVGGFSYAVPWMGDLHVSVEVGMEYNITTKSEGPFGALHLGFAY